MSRTGKHWSDDEIDRLARELPVPEQDPARSDSVRTAILIAAAGERPRKRRSSRRAFGAVALAASLLVALGISLWLSRESQSAADAYVAQPSARNATVHEHPGARFALVSSTPDEIVRLTEGGITIDVKKLIARERFRVITGDAEVEVRGTAFDVEAREDRLVSVRVLTGRVEVRPAGRTAVLLHPGEKWEAGGDHSNIAAPEPAAMNLPAAPVKPEYAPSRVALSRPRTFSSGVQAGPKAAEDPGLEPATGESAFLVGWEALQREDFPAAATAFARAESAANSRLTEDALFWEASALSRGGRNFAASEALRRFLETYPTSARSGEASAMLGWLLLRSGELNGAKLAFERALQDPVPDVQHSALEGMTAVEQLRGLLAPQQPAAGNR
jgi:hypothetical protein